jgi:hypothetical protein
VKPIKEESSVVDIDQLTVADVLVTFATLGWFGGGGNLDGSGALCRWRASSERSTVSEADHVVSPLSEDAAHVYKALSSSCKSASIKKEDEKCIGSYGKTA